MAFLSPSPLSWNVGNRKKEKRKKKKNTGLVLNTIPLKSCHFLFQLFCTILSSVCVGIEYVWVCNVYYTHMEGLTKLPPASEYNPIPTGRAYISLWLSP